MKKQIDTGERPDILDFHSHVLPGIDDGSPDAETSIKMLKLLADQGVKKVVATPHFDASRHSPTEFLACRDAAEGVLRNAMEECGEKDALPELLVGAEVLYFPGISRSAQIRELCVEGSDLLLLEMPFFEWNRSIVEEVFEIRSGLGVMPVLAHLDRYFQYQTKSTIDQILDGDLLIQINADAFSGFKTRKRVLAMLEKEQIDFLGSDCHDLSLRAPNFDKMIEVIIKKKRQDALCELYGFANGIFDA